MQHSESAARAWARLIWLLEKLPFFALAAAASVVTFVVQQQGGALAAREDLPFGARGGNALISYCCYLGKIFWPTDLAVYLSAPRAMADGGGAGGGWADAGHFGAAVCAAAAISLLADGVAVVCRDAGARHRAGAIGRRRRWPTVLLMCRRWGCWSSRSGAHTSWPRAGGTR